MTYTTQHTPGPWEASQYSQWAISSDNGHIAKVYGADGTHQTPEQARANAHLIAAAPELLAALEAAKAYMEDPYPDGDDLSHVLTRAGAAIAKARGE